MLEMATIREQLQDLLDKERRAMTAYAELVAKAADTRLREQFLQLQREKQRHVELAERLLQIMD